MKKSPITREIFIGSSSEGLKYAEKPRELLDVELESRGFKCTLWKDNNVFILGKATIESLHRKAMELSKNGGYAIMLVTPDDKVEIRGKKIKFIPRDNVIFELGLFLGSLGRERTFCVVPSNSNLKMLSDWSGITNATFKYAKRPRKNMISYYLETAVRSIRVAIDSVERPRVIKNILETPLLVLSTDQKQITRNILQEIERNMDNCE